MTSTPVIHMDQVSKVYRDFWRRPKVTALHDITLEVMPGTVLGLIGPNGAGKSTTLKILLGLLRPSSGTVQILGAAPNDVSIKARIGYLPEESLLPGFMTVTEALHFYGRLFALSGNALSSRVDQLITMLKLDAARHRPIRELSKGTVRRVGIAQALINDPELIILDEPTSGLDPSACRLIKDLILALARRGKTLILCSHVLADVEGVCHRVALLHAGRIRAEGPLSQLLAKPAFLTMTVPTPPTEQRSALTRAIETLTGHAPTFTTPSMTLEEYFLHMTDRQAATPDVPGNAAPTELAPFLINE